MALSELMLKELIPKIGQRAMFLNELEKLKKTSSAVSVKLIAFKFFILFLLTFFLFSIQYAWMNMFNIVFLKLYFHLLRKSS